MTPLVPPATIAFIGLGMMGRPMASRLAGAGFILRVFDLSQKAVSDFVGSHPSALATASAKAAAEGAEALITMLPDGKAVRQAVLEGRDAAGKGVSEALDLLAWTKLAWQFERSLVRVVVEDRTFKPAQRADQEPGYQQPRHHRGENPHEQRQEEQKPVERCDASLRNPGACHKIAVAQRNVDDAPVGIAAGCRSEQR